ncbi:hypothetical protein Bca52824_026354 [Brassica carinata]|uniref:Uncharacterized protein n=1 Tax=Brassica carinata TaxID=52824 RepID=A0A8X7VA96_BRACI|nr:hypothetical protein Bca52824_026354 [Brassica carinata]
MEPDAIHTIRRTPPKSVGGIRIVDLQLRNVCHSTERPVPEGSLRDSPSRSACSHNTQTPLNPPRFSTTLVGNESVLQRSGEGGTAPQGRKSALERLSLSGERLPLLQDGVANAASGRLQEVNFQMMEENLPLSAGAKSFSSSSMHLSQQERTPQQGITDRSPIRTLSEDRIHVSLRLGPFQSTDSDAQLQCDDVPLLSKVSDRLRADTSKKRVGIRE